MNQVKTHKDLYYWIEQDPPYKYRACVVVPKYDRNPLRFVGHPTEEAAEQAAKFFIDSRRQRGL